MREVYIQGVATARIRVQNRIICRSDQASSGEATALESEFLFHGSKMHSYL